MFAHKWNFQLGIGYALLRDNSPSRGGYQSARAKNSNQVCGVVLCVYIYLCISLSKIPFSSRQVHLKSLSKNLLSFFITELFHLKRKRQSQRVAVGCFHRLMNMCVFKEAPTGFSKTLFMPSNIANNRIRNNVKMAPLGSKMKK